MKKGLFIFGLIMLLGLGLYAQTKPAQAEDEGTKKETKAVKDEGKPTTPEKAKAASGKEQIKSVPAAKDQHAKPARVNNKRKAPTKPQRVRPARSPRPATRVIKPGRGR